MTDEARSQRRSSTGKRAAALLAAVFLIGSAATLAFVYLSSDDETDGPRTETRRSAQDERPDTSASSFVETYDTYASKDPFGNLLADETEDGEGSHTVELLDARQWTGSVDVAVDEIVYTVDVLERFATHFKLVTIDGDCASLLYGDDLFSLCIGDRLLK